VHRVTIIYSCNPGGATSCNPGEVQSSTSQQPGPGVGAVLQQPSGPAGDTALTGTRFILTVNAVVVQDGIDSQLTAVSMLFGAYYVLKLHYDESSAVTLEFIHR